MIRPYVWMLSGCFWFSLMALLAKAAGAECDWRLVMLARSGLVTAFALVAAGAVGARLAFVRPGALWLRSVAGSLSMLATFYALTRPDFPVSNTLTLTNTFPIWVALLAWPMTGERPTAGVWGAVVCSVAGVAVSQWRADDGFPPAAWASVAASVFTAVAMLGLNRLKGVSSLGVVVHFSAVATAFATATFAVPGAVDEVMRDAHVGAVPVLFGVGATATVGQVFLTLAFRAGSPTRVAVVGLSQVVMVMAMEAALGAKAFDLRTLVGTALVLGPTAWLMVREKRPPPPADGDAAVEEVAIE